MTYHNLLSEGSYRVRVLNSLREVSARAKAAGVELVHTIVGFEGLRPFLSRSARRGLREAIGDDRVKTIVFPILPEFHAFVVFINLIFGAVCLWALRAVWRFDMVHAHSHLAAFIGAAAKRMGASFSLLFDVHGVDVEERIMRGKIAEGSTAHRLTLWMQRVSCRNSDAVVCVTTRLQEYLEKVGGADPAVGAIVPCCIAPPPPFDDVWSLRERARSELGFRGKIVLGYLGSHARWQAAEETLDLFGACLRDGPDVRALILTGDVDHFLAGLKKRGIERGQCVVLSLSHDRVPDILPAMDVGVLLRSDTLVNRVACPTKFAEYLGSGVPVLTTDVLADMAELVRETGTGLAWTSPAGGPAEVSELLRYLRCGVADRRDRARRCLRAVGEALTWRTGGSRYWQCYARLLNAARRVNCPADERTGCKDAGRVDADDRRRSCKEAHVDVRPVGGRAVRMLWIRPRIPWPLDSGASRYSFGLLQELSKAWDITMVAPALDGTREMPPELTAHLDRLVMAVPANRKSPLHRIAYKIAAKIASPYRPEPALYMNWALEGPVRELLAAERYDLVQFEFWVTAGLAPVVGSAVTKTLVLHDVQYVRLLRHAAVAASPRRKARFEAESRHIRDYLAKACTRVDRVLTVTDADRDHVLDLIGDAPPVEALPAVMDIPELDPGAEADPNEILFVGVMTHWPNEDAVCYFCDEILGKIRAKASGARLSIVGRNMVRSVASRRADAVSIHEDVPSVRPFLDKAAVFVAPLRTGSGVKIKILEAMAHGKAVVTTSVGAEGLGVVPGEHLEVADDPDSFADAVVALLADAARRERIGSAGRQFVIERHSSGAAGAAIRKIYANLARGKGTETS